jgi:hypothetical protein
MSLKSAWVRDLGALVTTGQSVLRMIGFYEKDTLDDYCKVHQLTPGFFQGSLKKYGVIYLMNDV